MTTTEKLGKFKEELADALNGAINAGVPVQNVILELDTELFRLRLYLFQKNAERDAALLEKSIVPVAALPAPFTRTNGHGR